MARLLRTGLLPSAAHGATVSGITDSTLRGLRTIAGELVGAKKACSLTAYLFMQADVQFDPIFDCTIAVIREFSAWIWESRGSLGRLQRAWMQLKPNMDKNPTWALARGPLGAVWLSLLRIGWDMRSAHIIQDDMGETYYLLEFAPWDVRQLLIWGIQRWQMRRIASHLPEHDGEILWARGMRQSFRCKGGVWDGMELGALTCLWAGASWPRLRKFQQGLAESSTCLACHSEEDTHGHRWCRCCKVEEILGQDFQNDEGEPDCRQKRLQSGRRSMGEICDGINTTITSEYAIPVAPRYDPPPRRTKTFQWGNQHIPWKSVLFTDGSGQASDTPEHRRCGWAVVMLNRQNIPVRALYGGLPGPLQTVGRAERYALLQAVMAHEGVQRVVSDLL